MVPETAGAVEGYDPDEWHARWRAMEEIDKDPSLSSKQKLAAKREVNGVEGPPVEYRKPLADFDRSADGRRDLVVHEVLRKAGHEVVALAEDAPEGHSNIDLLIDGGLWEVKSPTSNSKGENSLRFVERNLRKAIRQFGKTEGGPTRPIRVVLNALNVDFSHEGIEKRVRLEMDRHDIEEVLLITGTERSPVTTHIKRPQGR